jgi:hypothetical protein
MYPRMGSTTCTWKLDAPTCRTFIEWSAYRIAQWPKAALSALALPDSTDLGILLGLDARTPGRRHANSTFPKSVSVSHSLGPSRTGVDLIFSGWCNAPMSELKIAGQKGRLGDDVFTVPSCVLLNAAPFHFAGN